MKKIIQFLKKSKHYKHLIGGFMVALPSRNGTSLP